MFIDNNNNSHSTQQSRDAANLNIANSASSGGAGLGMIGVYVFGAFCLFSVFLVAIASLYGLIFYRFKNRTVNANKVMVAVLFIAIVYVLSLGPFLINNIFNSYLPTEVSGIFDKVTGFFGNPVETSIMAINYVFTGQYSFFSANTTIGMWSLVIASYLLSAVMYFGLLKLFMGRSGFFRDFFTIKTVEASTSQLMVCFIKIRLKLMAIDLLFTALIHIFAR